ncbi:hypothetical protein [Enterococcus termitis]|uniref:WxL domain-containing protein n=1 Tax=Enterococcus termitis TaxID=332950 RepID=A0A1E5G966_9ENTE|nr:hypothetical protein [Enterococcus termitis]OEG09125.1 hypothetical protein BCR25_11180 [Enterococcus termitis]
MRQQRTKIKKWQMLGVGMTILGMGIWWSQSNTLLKAENEINAPSSEETNSKEKTTRSAGDLSRALTVVSNEQGLKATPKVVTIAQNGAFPTAGASTSELAKLVTGLTIPAPSTGFTFEYVDAEGASVTPSSAAEGFQTVYVKITEKTGSSSIQVPIPVNITNSTTTALLTNQAMVKADSRIILYPDEIKDKTNQEIQALIQSKANLSAWDMTSGESLPVSVTATTAVNNTVGSYTATFTASFNGTNATTTRTVTVFGATLRSTYFSTAQNTSPSMGTNGITYLLKYQTTAAATSTGATYEWVADKSGTPTVPANTYDASETGFKWGYIKMTDKDNPTVSTVIEVPITVTSDNVTISGSDNMAYGTRRELNILKKSDITDGTTIELAANLKEKLGLTAWDVTTGTELPITITDVAGLTVSSNAGTYELTFSITLADNSVKTVKRTYTLLADNIINDLLEGWQTVPVGATDGFIENPINNSKIGFNGKGMTGSANTGGSALQGFVIRDSANRTYIHNSAKVASIPFVDGKAVYPNGTAGLAGSNSADRQMGIGYGTLNSKFVSQFYLKKGNQLRQILVDQANQLVYVYDLKISQNLNFSVNLSMYNTASTTRSLAMLENVDTNYYVDNVPIYSLGNNSGFYMEPSTGIRFTIKLKDSTGQNLSDFSMQAPGSYTSASPANVPNSLQTTNWFKHDFSQLGIEQYNYAKDQVIVRNVDTAYQLGAPYRPVASGEALKAGYEIFAGTELPYMRLTSDPEEWNIYQDYQGGDFVTDYTLASIPHIGGNGTIYVEYPNEEKLSIPFIADQNLESKGQLTIPRSTLPSTLNNEPGSIKNYTTSMLGIHETEGAMENLPSNDYSVSVNVYNLGGQPIAQTIKQGTTWSKAASELIKDPVILPGHTAIYEYASDYPDTSKLGLQIVEVRMTDKEEPTQTKIIEVPVNVISGTPPTTGLTVAANDFTVSKAKLANLSETQIKDLILKESKAKGWDNATGLSTDIKLAVKTTDLTANPTETEYKATIQGTKDSVTSETTITISIGADLTAQPVAQSIPLGSDESYWKAANLKETVKDVMEGSNKVTDYTVTLVTSPTTDRITTDSIMTVNVANAADLSQSTDVEVPVNVTWGNSLALGGSGTTVNGSGQSTLALTLHEDSNERPYLNSAYGNLPKANESTALASAAADDPFYQVTYLDMSGQATGQSNAKEVNDGPNAVNDVTIQGLGSQTPAQLVDQLGTNGKLSVNYGDVLKVYVKQGQHALYTNNQGPAQPLADLPNNETIFVLVTKDGFKPLYFNQLTPKEVSIASESTATTELYDAHYNSLAAYFTTSGSSSNYTQIKPNGFKTYPKLNLAVGESDNGRVLVAEPTSTTSNQYVTYAYDTTFVGTGPELQIVSPLSSLSFGSQTIKSQTQEIKRTDPNWGFTVLDSRQTKAAWVIQAKMSEPFKTSDANSKQLKGAELKLKQASGTISLNSGYQTIYTKENPSASNNVTWSAEQGFFLQVPPGVIDKDAVYSTDVEFILTSAP